MDELSELVERFREGVAAGDADILTTFWVGDEDNLVYAVWEWARSLRTRDEIAQYYREALGPVGSVDTAKVTDLVVVAGEN
ncbi:hypothetical protein CDG81_03335 [Actinopolyspora erythraea]|uniref:SnoaL-like domain-containing protein n=1 Tax=Actinopolyspora erythraea TaxID=414996 RepID=A0A099D3A3_9ACTN|nr:hypothetical protein [Actinopolyspora erythraea]ASU77500.1 hypothetical protein CDG81_03335 [Actinopolyspora erythraea]KGI80287.1 hypothetical protein IL38_17645 [Actinopolyspora erythraea]